MLTHQLWMNSQRMLISTSHLMHLGWRLDFQMVSWETVKLVILILVLVESFIRYMALIEIHENLQHQSYC